MDRKNHHIAITWRENEASGVVLESLDFESFKRNMIDEGFSNIHTEWYEKDSNQLLNRYIVFVYWEQPDLAPEFESIKKWAIKSINTTSA